MRIKVESNYAKTERLKQWHNWFAWYPVRIGEHMIWLETVNRKGLLRERIYETPVWNWFYKVKK